MRCLCQKTKTMNLKEILECFKSFQGVCDKTVFGPQNNKHRNKPRKLLTTRKISFKNVKINWLIVAKL